MTIKVIQSNTLEKSKRLGVWKTVPVWAGCPTYLGTWTTCISRGLLGSGPSDSKNAGVVSVCYLHVSISCAVKWYQWEWNQQSSKCSPKGSHLKQPCKFKSKYHAMHLPSHWIRVNLPKRYFYISPPRTRKRLTLGTALEKGHTERWEIGRWVGIERIYLRTLGE